MKQQIIQIPKDELSLMRRPRFESGDLNIRLLQSEKTLLLELSGCQEDVPPESR